MNRYKAYKDSGVEWLGEIPGHWEIKRLGSQFMERRTTVSDADYEPLSVTKQGIFPQLENVAKTSDGDNRKLVKKGDFVINSRSDRKGSSGVSNLDGSVSLINIVLQPRGGIYGPFCNYLLKSYAFIEEYYRNGRGIVADLWTTRYDEMKLIKLAIPPMREQIAISEYLDATTARIDEAIARQQRMIDLLNERKKIIISKAVTIGVDDGCETKDSGVSWIGSIKRAWSLYKLKFLLRERLMYGANESAESENESYPRYIRITDIDEDGNLKPDTFVSLSPAKAAPYLLKKGDVLFARSGATAGKTFLFKEDTQACFAGYLIKASLGDRLLPEYLSYYTSSGIPKFRRPIVC